MIKIKFAWQWATFVVVFMMSCLSPPLFAQQIPTIDVTQAHEKGAASLAGQWGLHWGSLIPAEELLARKSEFRAVKLPNFLMEVVRPEQLNDDGYAFGVGTYAVRLTTLSDNFAAPAIRMRNVADAWQAWWLDDAGEVTFLGQSGKVAATAEAQEMRYRPTILRLPTEQQAGYLVVHVSAHVYYKSGIYGDLEIVEFEHANKSMMTDLIIRIALISIGLVVVFQNLVFFLQRPKEKLLLLLAVFAFAVLFRAIFSADYLYYFVADPDYFSWVKKPEYILVMWPAVAAMHFFAYVFPTKHGMLAVRLAYLAFAAASLFILLVPMSTVPIYLPAYQLILVACGIYVLRQVSHAFVVREANSGPMLMSILPLFIGLVNDITATYLHDYNYFIAEYTLFLFLLVQTQLQASRFVSALDTSEHLTENLQNEVALKTQQLSLRNQELEETAQRLKTQHDQIKMLSETDHLTGLFNRQRFDSFALEQFVRAQTNDTHMSLAMMDLDNFKQINDKYGHPVGDECLRETAAYLRNSRLRANDFVARYGGEEMVIVLVNANIEVAEDICNKICEGLRAVKVNGADGQIQLTASFGLAELKFNHADNLQHLINAADSALYAAKLGGKDRVSVAPNTALTADS